VTTFGGFEEVPKYTSNLLGKPPPLTQVRESPTVKA